MLQILRPPMEPPLRVLVCFLGWTLAPGCGGDEAPESGEPFAPKATVEVTTLAPEELRNIVEIPGQLESEQTVWVRSEIEGILASIDFEEGQQVAAGEILFQLRDDEQRARLRESEAELALAQDVFQRTKKLANKNVSSAAQLDRARAELSVAQARLELSRVQLERTRIPAPFAGVVGARAVSIGERVGEETRLVPLDSVDRLQLVFSLSEVAVGVVQRGAPVRIRVAPYPDEVFEGEVFFVSPTLDPLGRRIVLKAWIPNSDGRLRSGLFATIEAEIERRPDALMVPETAVVYDLDGAYVWRVGEDDAAERVAVEVGLHVEGRVEVRRGLRSGDEVVTAGTHKLQTGTSIDRAAPPPPAHAMGGGEPERGS
jgi:membrane fusion protein (multidrug efflux system)